MAGNRRKKGVLHRLADYLSVASLLLIIALVAAHFGRIGEEEFRGHFVAIDGDSLEMNGQRFRLEGIDAPEARQLCQRNGTPWQCGREATGHLRKLVNAGTVRCVSLGIDKYERILARCMAGDTEINRDMVAKGWAVSFGGYFIDEAMARNNKLGIWAGEFDRPHDWREMHSDVLDAGSTHGFISGLVARLRLVWQWLF